MQNPVTRKEIETLAQAGNEKILISLLGSRMEFGTAGKTNVSIYCIFLARKYLVILIVHKL